MQAAITDPNGPSTIRICPGVYVENLLIERNVTLIGAGDGADPAANTILQGTGTVTLPVVRISSGITATLQRLRITGGTGLSGGGIAHGGTALTLIDSTVTGNTSFGDGGGIFSGRSLTLIDSTVTGNTATSRRGGGIFIDFGTVRLINSTVTDNEATDGGGIFNDAGESLTLDATSRVTANTATSGIGSGGGVLSQRAGTVTIAPGGLVCGNTPDQCVGFSDPACQQVCPI